MLYDSNSKKIKSREKLIQYRKAFKEKTPTPEEKPQGEGALNRDGNPKIPPGQKVVENWPVLDLGVTPELDEFNWNLTVSGLVKHVKTFDWDAFQKLPQTSDVSDFHCVTSWSRMNNKWEGVKFSEIAASCEVLPSAKFVYIKAWDGYSTNLPLDEALKYDVLLVHKWENHPLTKEPVSYTHLTLPTKA